MIYTLKKYDIQIGDLLDTTAQELDQIITGYCEDNDMEFGDVVVSGDLYDTNSIIEMDWKEAAKMQLHYKKKGDTRKAGLLEKIINADRHDGVARIIIL